MCISCIPWGNYFQTWWDRSERAEGIHWHATAKVKKGIGSIFGVLNYLRAYFPVTAEVCGPLRQLTSVKTDLTWNGSYQKSFDKARAIIEEDASMKFYDEIRPVYLETDSYGVELETVLLQIRNGMNCPQDEAPYSSILRLIVFASKAYQVLKKRYNNLERSIRDTTWTTEISPLLLC